MKCSELNLIFKRMDLSHQIATLYTELPAFLKQRLKGFGWFIFYLFFEKQKSFILDNWEYTFLEQQ